MDNTKITHHITLCFQIVLQKMYPVNPKEQNFGQNPVWFVVWHDFLKNTAGKERPHAYMGAGSQQYLPQMQFHSLWN